MKSFEVKQAGKLSEQILKCYGIEMNYSALMKVFRKKDVKVNGKRTGKDMTLKVGDLVEVYYDGKAPKCEILYRDENVLAVKKPVKISSEKFYELIKKDYPSAGFVHRLDTNTDGIMVFSLNSTAETELLYGFKHRKFRKYYVAEVYGEFLDKEGILTAYLKKDAENSTVKIFDEEVEGAEKIITAYKTIERSEETSVLEVELVTGKTHQIRAHLAHEGHFVIGDGKYGKESINRKFHAKYQRLTAYRLVFGFSSDSPLSYLDGKEIKCNI